MINYDGKVGAIGRVPWYARTDPDHPPGALRRRKARCRCAAQTASASKPPTARSGEAIGKIDQRVARERFEGYTNKAETEKKILRDVFAKGDAWFRTGDLMRRDRHGYFYFVDRTGDTFRWKGENVATSEVAEALSVVSRRRGSQCLWRRSAGRRGQGRHGGASWPPTVSILRRWPQHLEKTCRPMRGPFSCASRTRSRPPAPSSSARSILQKEGFDPAAIKDPLYVRDPHSGTIRKAGREDLRRHQVRADEFVGLCRAPEPSEILAGTTSSRTAAGRCDGRSSSTRPPPCGRCWWRGSRRIAVCRSRHCCPSRRC